jgi:hypothetical protein
MKLLSNNSQPRSLSQREKVSYAVNAFSKIGIGREQALGALGGLAGESGRNLKTTSYNPNDPNGGSYGIGQWHSGRRTGLEDFAKKSKWGSIDDYRTQIDYVVHELQTTHKSVAERLKNPELTRKQATTIWTRKYEVPKKEFEHLKTRQKHADYFATLVDQGPKSPQAAIDAAPYQDPGSLTGGTQELSYTDPQVTTDYRDAPREGAGAFETILGGTANAVSGLFAGVNNAAKGVMNGSPEQVLSSQRVSEEAVTKAKAAGESTAAQAAGQAKGGIVGFMEADTTPGAVMGSLVGGYFGGPLGAIAGGLMGQGINKALSNISIQKQEEVEVDEANGIAGGVGRAMDGLFGGIGGMLGMSNKSQAQANQNSFPDRPESRSSWDGNYASKDSKGQSWSRQAEKAISDSKSKGGPQGLY